jgi:hypothetical protein
MYEVILGFYILLCLSFKTYGIQSFFFKISKELYGISSLFAVWNLTLIYSSKIKHLIWRWADTEYIYMYRKKRRLRYNEIITSSMCVYRNGVQILSRVHSISGNLKCLIVHNLKLNQFYWNYWIKTVSFLLKTCLKLLVGD